jgi:hypothetical protein
MTDNDHKQDSRKVLKFLPEFREKILAGDKVSTIRKGRVEKYKEGDVVDLMAGDEFIGEAIITNVKHRIFKEVSPTDARKDGFKSKSELKKALKKIYGTFKGNDLITQIEFRLVKRMKDDRSCHDET